MLKGITDPLKLSNCVDIPCVGFGTWRLAEGPETVEAVESAIVDCGYRLIDTASHYENETSVGKAIRSCGVPREKLFITTKVWNTERGYHAANQSFDKSLERLGLDYVDLYLIHWPATRKHYMRWEEVNLDTWRALQEIYRSGRARAIGVSNFKPEHLEALMEAEVQPMVNQIEFHPGCMQTETLTYCKENNILVEGWKPLGGGKLLDDPLLSEIAKKHKKTVAQVCLRWSIQHGVLPLVKSCHTENMLENAAIFDFSLTEDEMARIDAMPETAYTGLDPDTVDF